MSLATKAALSLQAGPLGLPQLQVRAKGSTKQTPLLRSSFTGRALTPVNAQAAPLRFRTCVHCSSKAREEKATSVGSSVWKSKLGDALNKGLQVLQKPAIAALAAAVVLGAIPDSALAASGGRVGGRVSGGGSSRSYSAPSRSYSAPSGGYSAPSYSAPSIGGGYAAPYFAPSPFSYGFGFSPFSFFAPPVVIGGGGGGGLFSFLLFGILVFFVVQTASGFLSGAAEGGVLTGGDKVTVMRVQVGLLGLARNLQKELDRIADRADTSSAQGLQYVLQETVLALMRHPEYCVYGRSSTDTKKGSENAEAIFNEMSLEERGKFDSETLVNVNSLRKRFSLTPKEERMNNEYIVVTILVAAEGNYKLPNINSAGDLRQALSTLGSIPTDNIQAVELLWTPQDSNDTLSEREMLQDYPTLRPL